MKGRKRRTEGASPHPLGAHDGSLTSVQWYGMIAHSVICNHHTVFRLRNNQASMDIQPAGGCVYSAAHAQNDKFENAVQHVMQCETCDAVRNM